MQRNLVISPAAASSSIEITEIDLGSALFAGYYQPWQYSNFNKVNLHCNL